MEEGPALEAASAATEAGKAAVEAGDAKTANTYASASRNFATTGGISNDKASAAHGRPTQITETIDIQERINVLKRMGIIEVEAEPALDAEAVAEFPPSKRLRPSSG